jgi:TetR/AcrR family transcriptional repressor of nem operon
MLSAVRPMTEGFFATADCLLAHCSQDQLERLLGYVDFRASIMGGELPDHTCLLGILVQETYATHPDIRAVCDKGMSTHIAALVRDIEAAKQRYVPGATWSAERLLHSVRPAGVSHLCEGKANLRCRSRAWRICGVI